MIAGKKLRKDCLFICMDFAVKTWLQIKNRQAEFVTGTKLKD